MAPRFCLSGLKLYCPGGRALKGRVHSGGESYGLVDERGVERRVEQGFRRYWLNQYADRPVHTASGGTLVRHQQVGYATPIHIRHRHRTGVIPARAVGLRRLEGSIAVVQRTTM